MKAILLPVLLLLSSTLVVAQKLPERYRVYTFDESAIDMNTSSLILGGDIGRVTFRWTFDQPETLSSNPQLKYKTRLETIEFKCADQRYRYYEVSLLDSTGKIIHSELMSPPYEWHQIKWEGVMGTMFGPACELIEGKLGQLVDSADKTEKASALAHSFAQTLQQGKDFKRVIEKFFAGNYLDGYLLDTDTNWFLNLDRKTAARASHAELQKFYVALLNAIT